ncbi:MAG: hypothetical protein PHH59_05260 [Methylovulum sp.]|uniref:hypothetical protein n=1 Tax=Methylovulum sp. TaxID=1916980 RepID=UPI0026312857|nr:hypothetical protein [Methylovulum sp.]MDD2723420.1 hypothetical protein [Methylovulum sp.]MDD5125582.1 hypothetical protein [Methylovulum sp.]
MRPILSMSFIASLLLLAGGFIIWLFVNGKLSLINTQEVTKSFSQFVAISGEDEFVVAKLITNEEFTIEKYTNLMGFPIGDSSVTLSLVANYKYFVNLSGLKLDIENDTVVIHVPKLDLSVPVAFDFSTVRESWREFLFAPDHKILLDQLRREVTAKLAIKGKSQINAVYDKAAKALADNFNRHFSENGYGGYYKSIVVVFASERSPSRRQFNYANSLCGKEACSLEIGLGKGLIFSIH